MHPKIALVSASGARKMDSDTEPLRAALLAAGAHASIVDWHDDTVDWGQFDIALLRSPWDYSRRLVEFLAWVDRTVARTELLNSAAVVRWNCDKHYLLALSRAGLPVVPTVFAEPHDDAGAILEAFLAQHSNSAELVVKPAVGAGTRDAGRYPRDAQRNVLGHMRRLLSAQRSVMLQPYLERVDVRGETALIFIADQFSHSVRKAALLPRDAPPIDALLLPKHLTLCTPKDDELFTARRLLSHLQFGPLLYARVDLVRDESGSPCLLELELVEPSLFLTYAPEAVERMSCALLDRLPHCRG